MLRRLRLSGLTETLEVRLHEASGNRLSHLEFLELILQDELLVRDQRKIGRRVKSASFRDQKSLEDFDWNFNPMISRKQMYELATGRFIKERRDVLLCSAPGTGKSHLIQAIGYQLIKLGYVVLYRSIFDVVRDFLHDEAMDGHDRVMNRYLKPDLLVIDDFGMKELPKRGGEFLFEIVMRRYETRSTMMTTNRPLEDWGKLLGDVPTATAILDRFLHHAEFLELILQDELLVRDERRIGRRVKSASFRDQKSLEDFDWNFNPMIKRKQMYELATGRFITHPSPPLYHACGEAYGPSSRAARRWQPSRPGGRAW
jgi:DNA replication protein DnaC